MIAMRYPDIRVSLSSDVAPEHREYERISTPSSMLISAPRSTDIWHDGERTTDVGIPVTPLIMQSNGGVVPLGPADGPRICSPGLAAAVTAAEVAKREGVQDVISIDIGGTSCDVCLLPAASHKRRSKAHPNSVSTACRSMSL